MSDENQATTESAPETTAPQTAAPSAPQTVTMTVEEYEAKLNERAAQTRKAVEAKFKQAEPQPKVKKADEPPQQGLSPDDVKSMMRRQSAFDRAVGKADLQAEQVEILETLFEIERPQDVAEWVDRKRKAFGQNTTTNQQPSPSRTSAPPPSVNSPPPQPAPSTAVANVPPDDVSRWNERQWEAYVRQNGVNSNPYHWSNMKVHQELARKYESSMANKLIVTKKG
jgi:hypothetical protein